MKLPIYLDYSATTPVDLRIAEKMIKYLSINGIFGNPASRSHRYGWEAEKAVAVSRNYIATLIGADSREIIFTSGATESNNLAIKGVAYANYNKGRHIITSLTEHESVLDTCRHLEKQGFFITWLKPLYNGIISLEQLINAFRQDTILVSLMHVNNETGVIQDIVSFGEQCRIKGIYFHVDATQSVGKLHINLHTLPVDLMSFSGHKIYGPKGIGVLFVRRNPKVYINSQIHGGKHERGLRSGTLPVHQIVGIGESCRILIKEMFVEYLRMHKLRNKLYEGLKNIPGIFFNGDYQKSIATLLNVSFEDIHGELLIAELKNLAVSSGSACSSAKMESSYVLQVMGLNDKLIQNSIRISFGRFTTIKEIEYAIININSIVMYLRKKK